MVGIMFVFIHYMHYMRVVVCVFGVRCVCVCVCVCVC